MPEETTDVAALFARQTANARLSRAEALRAAMMALLDGPGFDAPFSYKLNVIHWGLKDASEPNNTPETATSNVVSTAAVNS